MRLPSIRQLNKKYVLLTDIYADYGVCVEMEGFIAPRDESQRFVVPVKDLQVVDRFPNYADDVDVWERLMRTSSNDVVTGAIEALTLEKRHDLVSMILLPKAHSVTGARYEKLGKYNLKENALYSAKRNNIELLLVGSSRVTIKRNGKRERVQIDDLVRELNEGQYIEQRVMTKGLAGSMKSLLQPLLGAFITGILISYVSRQLEG